VKSIQKQPSHVKRVQPGAENQSVVEVVIIKTPCSSGEEFEQKPASYKVKPNYVYSVQDRDTLIEQSP